MMTKIFSALCLVLCALVIPLTPLQGGVLKGQNPTYKEVEITDGGLTLAIDANDFIQEYYFIGTADSLYGNVAISVNGGTYAKRTKMTAYWECNAVLGSGTPTITVFGATIPSNLWAKEWKVEATYNGSAWVTRVYADFTNSEIVSSSNITEGAVTAAKIGSGAVTESKIGSGAITSVKIADYAVGSTKIDTAAVVTLAIDTGAVTTAKIATGAVTADEIGSNAVTTAKINDLAVTTAKINSTAVTTAKIASTNVTAAELASNAVTTAKVADANITTVKIADDNVTAAKLDQETRTELITTDVSFVTAAQGTYRVLIPFDATLIEAKARVTSTISGSDTAYIYLQNNSATEMGGSPLKFAASTAHGTAVSVTPSSNNVFQAGEEILLLVQKTTSGGAASVSLKFERD